MTFNQRIRGYAPQLRHVLRWSLVAACVVPAVALGASFRLPFFKGRKETAETEPLVTPSPEPEPLPPPPTLSDDLFGNTLPIDVTQVDGLANASAQGCHACHPDAVQAWSDGPHAKPPPPALLAMAEKSGTSGCTTCHLPLRVQHDRTVTWSEPEPSSPDANPNFDATLHVEGVTCVTCHAREGRVAVGTEAAARGVGPHMVALAPDLAEASTCAACHQLTWPGTDTPFYDTFGEWTRSAWAEAGVSCLDCHGSANSGHVAKVAPGRGVSVLLDVDSRHWVRGAAPTVVRIALQNTGAGHALPTGSPFRGLRLQAYLQGPGATPKLVSASLQDADLVRTLQDEPPWSTVTDTRLGAGETREWAWQIALGADAPAGGWDLVVELVPTLVGEVDGAPIVTRRLPIVVE